MKFYWLINLTKSVTSLLSTFTWYPWLVGCLYRLHVQFYYAVSHFKDTIKNSSEFGDLKILKSTLYAQSDTYVEMTNFDENMDD